MIADVLSSLAKSLINKAPSILAQGLERLRPLLNLPVKVTVRIEADGPGSVDPIFEVSQRGVVGLEGIHLTGSPSIVEASLEGGKVG